MAFASTSTIVGISSYVKTGQGLLPSLGAADWNTGESVYWYGSRNDGRERPITVGNYVKLDREIYDGFCTGAVTFSGVRPLHGDSGGPVYRYATDSAGRYGVVIIGMLVKPDCFIPVRHIERKLGVRVAVTPS
jgi:hypothetical protein